MFGKPGDAGRRRRLDYAVEVGEGKFVVLAGADIALLFIWFWVLSFSLECLLGLQPASGQLAPHLLTTPTACTNTAMSNIGGHGVSTYHTRLVATGLQHLAERLGKEGCAGKRRNSIRIPLADVT